MAWVIGIAVVAFMLAPLIWILPNPRQQRQTRLREAARLRGLQVRVTTLPQTRRQRVRREAEQAVVSYTRPLYNRHRGTGWKLWLQGEPVDDEDQLPADSPLQTVIAEQRSKLPEDSLLLEYTGLGLTLYWSEKGDRGVVESLAEALNNIVRDGKMEDGDGDGAQAGSISAL